MQTDMSKLMVTFHKFANTPKKAVFFHIVCNKPQMVITGVVNIWDRTRSSSRTHSAVCVWCVCVCVCAHMHARACLCKCVRKSVLLLGNFILQKSNRINTGSVCIKYGGYDLNVTYLFQGCNC